jgi:uncharacterized protein YndB with AHSA1/START domain
MMSSKKPIANRELTITRTFDAPRDLVFKAWTDPKHVAQWWGPHGFTNPVCEVDARPGGNILIHMRGPDGTIHAMTGIFWEVVVPDRIVFTTTVVDANGSHVLEGYNVVTFAERGRKTVMTLQAKAVGFVAIAEQMLKGMEAGWTQSIDRLEQFVAHAHT